MERKPQVERLRELLRSLDIEDNEHPGIALTHETGWSLNALASGRVVWENVEAGGQQRQTYDKRAAGEGS